MNGCVVTLWMYSLLPWCYLRVSCRWDDRAVRTLSAVCGDRVCSIRVSCLWLACVGSVLCERAGHRQPPSRPGRALNSVPRVSVGSLLQSGKPCKQLGLHSFAPAVCHAALSVSVRRLCPAEVAHCLCRGTLGKLEETLMVPWDFVTSVAVVSAVHVRANLVVHPAVCEGRQPVVQQSMRAAVGFSSFCHASLEHFCQRGVILATEHQKYFKSEVHHEPVSIIPKPNILGAKKIVFL